jgi:hypothetical protein
MWQWNGTGSWIDRGLVYPTASGQKTEWFSIDTDQSNGDMYVLFQDTGWRHEVMCYKWKGVAQYFDVVGSPAGTVDFYYAGYNTDIRVKDSNHVYAAYIDHDTGYVTVSVFNGTAWSIPAGFKGMSGVTASSISMELNSGSPWVSYKGGTCSNDISVKKYE